MLIIFYLFIAVIITGCGGNVGNSGNLSDNQARALITSFSGTIKNGNVITIGGVRFGVKTIPAPLISSYDHPISANNWSTGLIGGNWTVAGTPPPDLVNSSPRTSFYQSSYKGRYQTHYSGGSDYHTIRHLHMGVESYGYASFWLYRDYTAWSYVTGSGNNTKYFRMYISASVVPSYFLTILSDVSTGGLPPSPNGVLSSVWEVIIPSWSIAATGMNAYRYSSTMYDARATQAHVGLSLQTWEHYEVLIKYSSTPGALDGEVTVYKDGRLHNRSRGVATCAVSDSPDRRWYLIGQVSGGRTVDGYEYLDQVYIDNSFSRIIVSNKADLTLDYPTAAHNEIQIPSTWSEGFITFTFNQGSFNNGDIVYLYVVDPTGSISNPATIVVGATY